MPETNKSLIINLLKYDENELDKITYFNTIDVSSFQELKDKIIDALRLDGGGDIKENEIKFYSPQTKFFVSSTRLYDKWLEFLTENKLEDNNNYIYCKLLTDKHWSFIQEKINGVYSVHIEASYSNFYFELKSGDQPRLTIETGQTVKMIKLNEIIAYADDDVICKMKTFWEKCVETNKGFTVTNGIYEIDESTLRENIHQHTMLFDIMTYLQKNDNFIQYKNKPEFFNDSLNKPDIVFVKKSKPFKPNFCSFIVELQLGKIDNDHKGKLLTYCQQVLNEVPTRQFIIGAVTNLDKLIFFAASKDNDITGNDQIYYDESIQIDFWSNEGLSFFYKMINEPKCVGFDDSLTSLLKISPKNENEEYYVNEFLGKGATASVFRLLKYNKASGKSEKSNYAIKIFNNKYLYNEELNINNMLLDRFDFNLPQGLIQEVKSFKFEKLWAIVYQPIGEPIEKKKLTKTLALEIFDAVGKLHKRGIIHRDLSPNHLFQVNDHILIIDFGCATFTCSQNLDLNISDDKPGIIKKSIDYQGSIQFAAIDILNHLVDPNKYEYTPHLRHDLESVVRSLMYLHYGLSISRFKKSIQSSENSSSMAKNVCLYWEDIDKRVDSKFWSKALEIVRRDKDTNIEDELRKHFENFSFCHI